MQHQRNLNYFKNFQKTYFIQLLTRVSSTDSEMASPKSSDVNRRTFLAGTEPSFSGAVSRGGTSGWESELLLREITFFSDLTAWLLSNLRRRAKTFSRSAIRNVKKSIIQLRFKAIIKAIKIFKWTDNNSFNFWVLQAPLPGVGNLFSLSSNSIFFFSSISACFFRSSSSRASRFGRPFGGNDFDFVIASVDETLSSVAGFSTDLSPTSLVRGAESPLRLNFDFDSSNRIVDPRGLLCRRCGDAKRLENILIWNENKNEAKAIFSFKSLNHQTIYIFLLKYPVFR